MDPAIARSLEPELHEACEGRLHDLRWVQMDWQHGGALTGFAEYRTESGDEIETFVKFPVPGRELRWSRRLQSCDDPPVIPRLLASGASLGTHDIAWLVMERIPGAPLGARWKQGNLAATARAGARLHACSADVQIDRPKRRDEWEQMLEKTKATLEIHTMPDHDAWVDGIRRAEDRWTDIIALWRSREPISWVHGDLHMGNAMQRENGEVCLVDLAEVRPGHWIEDALYLERMYWAREDRIMSDDPLGTMRTCRSELGLDNGDGIEELAMARRILLAATTPAFLAHEGAKAHLKACLEVLARGLEDWEAR